MAFHPNDTNFENGLFFRKTIYSTIWKERTAGFTPTLF
jgi:hypothetical protein